MENLILYFFLAINGILAVFALIGWLLMKRKYDRLIKHINEQFKTVDENNEEIMKTRNIQTSDFYKLI